MIKLLAAGVLAMVLAGCATQPVTLAASSSTASAPRFTLQDERPAKESKHEMLSYLLTSCNYGIMRLGDDETLPNKIDVLKGDLNDLAGDKLAGKTVVVKSYTVHFNQAVALRGLTRRMYGGGLITNAMIDIGCKKNEVSGGWYEGNEVTGSYSPFIADLTLTVDGHSYSSHVVKSPDTDVAPSKRSPQWPTLARDILKQTAANIAMQLH